MIFTKAENVELKIPREAIETVFAECDRYDEDETGGRILGTYEERGGVLSVSVSGVIEPGPNAKRSPTYFKQDGDYQERVFRQVEDRERSVEHLGNWHTHHVNGLRHLSPGDIETYQRTVEHQQHNIDFFYALLVIERRPSKTGLERYIFKNYLLRRGDPAVYEIPAAAVRFTESPLVWPVASTASGPGTRAGDEALKRGRVYDNDFVTLFYPKIAPYQSKLPEPGLGLYWRGSIHLVDGSDLQVVVLEDASGSAPTYRINLRECPDHLARACEWLAERDFPSCRSALLTAERVCNVNLFEQRSKVRRWRIWTF